MLEMDPSAVPEPYVYSAPVTPNPAMDLDTDEDGEVVALVWGPMTGGNALLNGPNLIFIQETLKELLHLLLKTFLHAYVSFQSLFPVLNTEHFLKQ